jgi:hypothetical protein
MNEFFSAIFLNTMEFKIIYHKEGENIRPLELGTADYFLIAENKKEIIEA